MTLFHNLLIRIYKQWAKRVTEAHFRLCLPLLPPQMLLQCGTENANILALWRVAATVRVKAPVTYRKSVWGYSSVTVAYSFHFHTSSWSHSLSGNAFSLSNDCIGSEETKTCGTYTLSCCWNHCTRVTVSWIGSFLSTFEVQAYGSRDFLVTCWISVELCSSWICHFYNVKASDFTSS